MINHYAVIRFLPDALREEFINIGVAVVAEDGSFAQCRFAGNWCRAQMFDGGDVSFLDDVVRQFEGEPLTRERLEGMHRDWQNSIQVSDVRASIAEPGALLDRVYEQFIAAREVR